MTDIYEKIEEIRSFPSTVKDVLLNAETDEERVDILGAVKYCEREFGTTRRGVEAELDYGVIRGQEMEVTIPRKATRSYNTMSLLAAFTYQLGSSPLQAFLLLKESGALSVKWNWTKLQQAMTKHGIGVRIAQWEIEDGDPEWDIGEVWSNASATYTTTEE